MNEAEAFVAALGGFVHDLGKVAIPDHVLLKPAELSGEELAAMRTHPSVGRGLLEDHPLGALVLDTVFRHHERFDGQGYPAGLRESDLAVYTRIVSVADAFDAMTSTRPYRTGLPKEEAIARLIAERNRQFDGDLVDRAVSLAKAGTLDGVLGHSDHETPMVDCPGCGPVIAVRRNAEDGDTTHCRVCRNRFRLHAQGNTFAAEFLNERALALVIEPELEQIEGFMRDAPRRLKL
jgi:hypothetical protein